MLAIALACACDNQVFTTGKGGAPGGGEGGAGGNAESAGQLGLSASNVRSVTLLGGMQSKPGHVYLAVDATLANQSVTKGIVDNPTFFSVLLASNLSIALSPSFAALTNACTGSVTVNPGASTTCGLVFEIPEGDRAVSLTYRDPAGPSATAQIPEAPREFEGDWLLSLSMVLKRESPIVYRVTITKDQSVGFLVQGTPLSADDQTTPVGSVGMLGSAVVASDGSLDVAIPSLMMPAAANPIINGDVVASDIALDAVPATSPTFLCGELRGQVTSPTMLNLSGSTFTLQRIEGPLPAPLLSCDREPASFD